MTQACALPPVFGLRVIDVVSEKGEVVESDADEQVQDEAFTQPPKGNKVYWREGPSAVAIWEPCNFHCAKRWLHHGIPHQQMPIISCEEQLEDGVGRLGEAVKVSSPKPLTRASVAEPRRSKDGEEEERDYQQSDHVSQLRQAYEQGFQKDAKEL